MKSHLTPCQIKPSKSQQLSNISSPDSPPPTSLATPQPQHLSNRFLEFTSIHLHLGSPDVLGLSFQQQGAPVDGGMTLPSPQLQQGWEGGTKPPCTIRHPSSSLCVSQVTMSLRIPKDCPPISVIFPSAPQPHHLPQNWWLKDRSRSRIYSSGVCRMPQVTQCSFSPVFTGSLLLPWAAEGKAETGQDLGHAKSNIPACIWLWCGPGADV